jgi:hypothetical protein
VRWRISQSQPPAGPAERRYEAAAATCFERLRGDCVWHAQRKASTRRRCGAASSPLQPLVLEAAAAAALTRPPRQLLRRHARRRSSALARTRDLLRRVGAIAAPHRRHAFCRSGVAPPSPESAAWAARCTSRRRHRLHDSPSDGLEHRAVPQSSSRQRAAPTLGPRRRARQAAPDAQQGAKHAQATQETWVAGSAFQRAVQAACGYSLHSCAGDD